MQLRLFNKRGIDFVIYDLYHTLSDSYQVKRFAVFPTLTDNVYKGIEVVTKEVCWFKKVNEKEYKYIY